MFPSFFHGYFIKKSRISCIFRLMMNGTKTEATTQFKFRKTEIEKNRSFLSFLELKPRALTILYFPDNLRSLLHLNMLRRQAGQHLSPSLQLENLRRKRKYFEHAFQRILIVLFWKLGIVPARKFLRSSSTFD